MNNLNISGNDSDSEENIPARHHRADHGAKNNALTDIPINAQNPGEMSEGFDEESVDCCSICLEFFDTHASALPCGHIFHRDCVINQEGSLKYKKCPLCLHTIHDVKRVRKLILDPNELGSDRLKSLTCSNKRLEKQIIRMTSDHAKLKEDLQAKDRETLMLSNIIKQHEEEEKEIFAGKEVDLQFKEKYTKGIVHACCKNKDCEHSSKFMEAIVNLGENSKTSLKCLKIISKANKRFIKDAIKNGLKSMKEHSFKSTLPFYVERCSKLGHFMGTKEINKRNDLFKCKGEVFEIFKDFGRGYDQQQVDCYCDLVQNHKKYLIANAGIQPQDNDAAVLKDDIFEREYVYDKDQREEMLSQACAQLAEKQEEIDGRIKKITKEKYSKEEGKENYGDQVTIFKKQSELLDKVKEHLVMKEKNVNYYRTEQERKEVQILKDKQSEVQREARASKKKTYKEWRSDRFKSQKEKANQKKARGNKSSEESKRSRIIRAVCDKIYYGQEKIDFEALFKEFGLFL